MHSCIAKHNVVHLFTEKVCKNKVGECVSHSFSFKNVDFCGWCEEDYFQTISFPISRQTGRRDYLPESWQNININTITTL